MKTSVQVIEETLEGIGKSCDGWRKTPGQPEVCPYDNSPVWAFTARHTKSGGVNCDPVTYLLCDQCHDLAWGVLLQHAGKVLRCECGARGLTVPHSYVLSDVKL